MTYENKLLKLLKKKRGEKRHLISGNQIDDLNIENDKEADAKANANDDHVMYGRIPFQPKQNYQPDYLYDEAFRLLKYDALYTNDIIKLNALLNDLSSLVIDLEIQVIIPGTDVHRDLLIVYIKFIDLTNQLHYFERRLISLERHLFVRCMMEKAILGLLRTKHKLTSVECFNITYTINASISLGLSLDRIETNVPNSDYRMKEIRALISNYNVEGSENDVADDKNLETIQDEQNNSIKSEKAQESKDRAKTAVSVCDVLVSSFLREKDSQQIQEIRNQIDEPSILILERVIYNKIFIKHNPATLSHTNFVYELEKHYQDYLQFFSFLWNMQTSRSWENNIRLLTQLQKYWRDYSARAKNRLLQNRSKNEVYFFYGTIKGTPERVTENIDDIEEGRTDYIQLYKKMYSKCMDFIERYKEYEYIEEDMLKIIANWRENNRKELPLFIKSIVNKTVRTGFKSWINKTFVEFSNELDLIKIELMAIQHKNKIFETNKLSDQAVTILKDTIKKKFTSTFTSTDQLQRKLPLENNIEIADEILKNNGNPDETPEPFSKNSIMSIFMEFKATLPVLKQELELQKEIISKTYQMKKKQMNSQKKRRNLCFDVTYALTRVVNEVFDDLSTKTLKPMVEVNDVGYNKKNKSLDRDINPNSEAADNNISVNESIALLIRNKIIVDYPETNIANFFSNFYFCNEDLILESDDLEDPLYTSRWLIQTIKEFCILPLFSESVHKNAPLIKSVLLAGPPKCGKDMIVNAICTHVGAVKFDLSAKTIVNSEFYNKTNGLKLLETLVMRIGRHLQPSIFYIDKAHEQYLLSNPPKMPNMEIMLSETNENAENQSNVSLEGNYDTSFLGDVLRAVVSQITKNDLILVVGVTNKPFLSDMKLMEQMYNKILVFPRVDHDTAHSFLFEKLMEIPGVDRHFSATVLAELCTGMPIPDMEIMVNKVFTLGRKMQLCQRSQRPLLLDDFLEVLQDMKHLIVGEEYEDLIFNWYDGSKIGKLRRGVLMKLRENAKTEEIIDEEDKIK